MNSIRNLKQELNFDKQAKSFDSITKAAKDVDISLLEKAADAVGKKFSALEIAAITAVSNITNRVISGAENIANQVSDIAMAGQGWDKYNRKVQAVQTIMKATGEDIDSVSYKLQDLADYTDKTSYSYSQMVDNIGKFTANGVGLEDAIKAIEGVANVAALSGVGATDPAAARAMYNFSQALAAGSVKAIDWKSIENANMATKQFKDQIIQTAKAVGTLNKEGRTAKGTLVTFQNFRETLSEGWFSSDVLIATLKEFADAESEVGQRAYKAAAEAKTFQDALGAVQDAASSTWSKTFEIIFGNYERATKLWTEIQDTVLEFMAPKNEARNNILEEAFTSGYEELTNFLKSAEVDVTSFENGILDVLKRRGVNVTDVLKDKSLGEYLQYLNSSGVNTTSLIYEGLEAATGQTSDLVSVTKEYQTLIGDIINGKWGHGADRFAKLREAGYDDDLVQELVNKSVYGETIDWEKELAEYADKAGVSLEELIKKARESGTTLQDLISGVGDPGSYYYLWDGIRQVFASFRDILGAIKEAWFAVFPALTGKDLNNALKRFHEFAVRLKPSEKALNNLKRTLTGVFSIFKLVGDAIGAVLKGIFAFIRGFKQGEKSIGDFTGDLGDRLTEFTKRIRESEVFQKIAETVTNTLKTVWTWFANLWDALKNSETLAKILEWLRSAISDLWETVKNAFSDGGFFSKVAKAVGDLWDALAKFIKENRLLERFGEAVEKYWNALKNFVADLHLFENLKQWLEGAAKSIKDFWSRLKEVFSKSGFFKRLGAAFSEFWKSIKQAFSDAGTGIEAAWTAIKTLFSNIGSSISDLWTQIGKTFSDIGTGLSTFWQQIKDAFDGKNGLIGIINTILIIVLGILSLRIISKFATAVTDISDGIWGLSTAAKKAGKGLMFQGLAKTLIAFAEAIAIIAGVAVAISFVPQEQMNAAINNMITITLLVIAMLGASAIISKMAGDSNFAGLKIAAIAGIFTALGTFFTALTYAIVSLTRAIGDANPKALKDAITILVASLGAIAVMMIFLTRNEKKHISGFLAFIGISVYMLAMVNVLKKLSNIPSDKLQKGLIGLAALVALLIPVIVVLSLLGKRTAKAGVGILLTVMSLNMLIGTIKNLAKEDPKQLREGLANFVPIFTALAGIMISLIFAKNSAKSTGSAFLAIAIGIGILSFIMRKLGEMSDEVASKGLSRLAILAVMAGVLVALAGIFSKIGKVEKQAESTGFGKKRTSSTKTTGGGLVGTIIGITIMLTVLAAMVALLGSLHMNQLSKGLVVVGILSFIIVAILAALASVGKAKNPKELKSTVITMALLITVLIAGLAALTLLTNPDQLLKAAEALALVLAALAVVFVIVGSSSGFKNIERLGGTLIGVVALLALAIGAVGLLQAFGINQVTLEQAAALGVVMLALALAFRIISGSKGLDTNSMGAAWVILMQLGVNLVLAAAALAILQGVGVENVLEKALALGGIMLAMAGAFWIIASAPAFKEGEAGRTAGVLIILGVCLNLAALAIGILQAFNIEGVLEKAGALAILFGTLSLAFLVISIANDKFKIQDGEHGPLVLTLVGLVVIMALCGFLLGLISWIETWNPMASYDTLLKLGTVLGEMLVLTVALGLIGKFLNPATVGQGLLSFIEVIGIMLLFVSAIGGLSLLIKKLGGDLNYILNEGFDILVTLADGLGRVVGALIGGVVEGFMESVAKLPEMADDIALFAEKLGGVDTAKLDTIKSLADALLALTANNALSSLMSIFGADNSYDKIFENLADTADSLTEFVKSIAELSEDDLDKASLAADIMKVISEGTPNDGGLVGLIVGNKDYTKFSDGIKNIATGISEFSTTLKDTTVDDNLVLKAENAGKIMSALADSVPRQGGLLDMILGEQRFSDNGDKKGFPSQLKGMAEGVIEFVNTVKSESIDAGAAEKAENAGKIMSALGDAVPREGGVLGWLLGDKDFEGFSKQLPYLADGILGFDSKMNEYSGGHVNTDRAKDVADVLKTFSESAPTSGGLLDRIFGTGNPLGDFASNLPSIGTAMGQFASSVQNISNWHRLESTVTNLGSLIDFAGRLQDMDMTEFYGLGWHLQEMSVNGLQEYINSFGDTTKLEELKTNILALGQKVVDGLNEKKPTITDTALDIAEAMISSLRGDNAEEGTFPNQFWGIGYEYADKLKEGFGSEAQKTSIIKALSSTVQSFADGVKTEENQKSFVSVGKWMLVRIGRGLADADNVADLKRKAQTNGPDKVEAAWNEYETKFETCGKNFLLGLKKGLDNATIKWQIYNSAKSAGDYAEQGIRDALDINSPSKVAETLGKFFGEGFAGGIGGSGSIVEQAANLLGINAEEGLSGGLGGILSSLFGVDLSSLVGDGLTLTPVLDLSQITAGAGDISSILGGVGGLDLGSGTMSIATNAQNGFNANAGGLDLNTMFGNLSQQMADFMNTPNVSNTNTFNITGDDPQAIADAVSKVLNEQTQREAVVWA